MRSLEKQIYTLEEYLELDHASEEKIEFWDGHIWKIGNSFSTFCRIKVNLLFEIGKVRNSEKQRSRIFPDCALKFPLTRRIVIPIYRLYAAKRNSRN